LGRQGFRKYRRADVRAAEGPVVAIHRRGMFALSEVAWSELGKPEACELYWDPEGVIGFKAAPRDAADSFVLRAHSANSRQVEGRKFIKHIGLPEEAMGRRYRARMEDDILTVDIHQADEISDSA
jgi:hypothetical protein